MPRFPHSMGSNIMDVQGGIDTATTSPTAGEAATAAPAKTPREECWRVIEDPKAAHVAWHGRQMAILPGSIIHVSVVEAKTLDHSLNVVELLKLLQQSWQTADAAVKAACRCGVHLHVVRPLGSGSQCQVLLVQPIDNLGMPCAQRMALKVMLNASLNHRDQLYDLELAFREMVAGMLVGCDDLVTCLGTGFAGIRMQHGKEVVPVTCVLMEVCQCFVREYLEMRNEAGQPCSMLERMMYARSALKATTYLHDNRFVHRDLKLDNLLLSQDHTAKLADFGCCRLIDSSQCQPGIYDTSSRGTAGYQAPERVYLEQFLMRSLLWDMLTHARQRSSEVAIQLEKARATHQQLQQELYVLQQQQHQHQQQQQQRSDAQHPMELGLPVPQLETPVQQLQCRVAGAFAAVEALLKEKCQREEYVLLWEAKVDWHQQLVANKVEWDKEQFSKADMWSFGCVFLELLTPGERAFRPVLARLGARASNIQSILSEVLYGIAEQCGNVAGFLQSQYHAARYPWVSNSKIMTLLGKLFNILPEDRPTAAEALIEMESLLKDIIAESEDDAYLYLHEAVGQAAKTQHHHVDGAQLNELPAAPSQGPWQISPSDNRHIAGPSAASWAATGNDRQVERPQVLPLRATTEKLDSADIAGATAVSADSDPSNPPTGMDPTAAPTPHTAEKLRSRAVNLSSPATCLIKPLRS